MTEGVTYIVVWFLFRLTDRLQGVGIKRINVKNDSSQMNFLSKNLVLLKNGVAYPHLHIKSREKIYLRVD